MNSLTPLFNVLKKTIQEFQKDNATQMAAALSYYALFAIPPMLLIILSILTIFYGNQGQQTMLIETQEILGPDIAQTLRLVISNLDQYAHQSTFAQWIGIITFLIAATTAVRYLQKSLNTLWGVAPPPRPLLHKLRQRMLSLVFITIIGFFLLISFVLHAALNILGSYAPDSLGITTWGEVFFSFAAVTLLIVFMFKFLPEGKIAWKDLFVGAGVTACLFLIGQFLLSVYFQFTSLGSVYGAAGSILVLIVWVYYSSLIFFFGAEFTKVYAQERGQGITE